MLALLLGFSFTMGLQRFDSRSQATIEEANAIGTTYLRTQLLPAPLDETARLLLSDYVDLRLEGSSIDLTEVERRRAMAKRVTLMHARLWQAATAAAEADPRPAGR